MTVYISIPIKGKDESAQRRLAAETAEKIRACGHEPVNPFDTPEPPDGYDGERKYAYYMSRDIERLMLCDAIFMCDGWERSMGCRIERSIASAMLKFIYTDALYLPDNTNA